MLLAPCVKAPSGATSLHRDRDPGFLCVLDASRNPRWRGANDLVKSPTNHHPVKAVGPSWVELGF
jgi:hypothetical protein